MNHRKDDIVTSDGPGPGYEQRVTRSTADGRETDVSYFDRAGRDVTAQVAAKPAPGA